MAGRMMVFHCKGRNYFSLDVFDNTETASSLIRYKHNSSFQLLRMRSTVIKYLLDHTYNYYLCVTTKIIIIVMKKLIIIIIINCKFTKPSALYILLYEKKRVLMTD